MTPTPDPRRDEDFQPALYPACDGAPLASECPAENVKAQFLGAYYRINACYAKLAAFREAGRPRDSIEERELLRAVERAIVSKERLEDAWAPQGVLAAPVLRHGLTVDVRFCSPSSPKPELKVIRSSSSMVFGVGFHARP